jgi:murein L,D-transpeptidase YafK
VQSVNGQIKTTQLKFSRVKKAYDSKFDILKNEIVKAGFNVNSFEIYLRVFKQEKQLQVWMKDKNDTKFKLFKTYAICANSGELGPKRQEGDGQVPEGFYEIESFNPASSYHLSMKVNYPNASDRIKAKGRTGGDIMIHGECVTIGCVPIENDPIEELYILCLEAKDRKGKLRVDMFPCKLTEENMKRLEKDHSDEKYNFWKNIKLGYDHFEKTNMIPKYSIDNAGNYKLRN